jgi:hypothetical protein
MLCAAEAQQHWWLVCHSTTPGRSSSTIVHSCKQSVQQSNAACSRSSAALVAPFHYSRQKQQHNSTLLQAACSALQYCVQQKLSSPNGLFAFPLVRQKQQHKSTLLLGRLYSTPLLRAAEAQQHWWLVCHSTTPGRSSSTGALLQAACSALQYCVQQKLSSTGGLLAIPVLKAEAAAQ